jgi:flagellar biosynthesis/type III secretory pathway protein FliH
LSLRSTTLRIGNAPVLDAVELPLDGREPLTVLLARAEARGRIQGHAQAAGEGASLLATAAAALEARQESLISEAAQAALELGLVVAKELVLRDVNLGNHDVEAIVRSALVAASAGRAACVVHLNPMDAASLAEVEFRSGTTVESDPGVRRGDVQLETPVGLMVREMDETLRELSLRLREELTP